MPSITNSVNSLLGRGGNFEKLGKAVGVDKDKAELAVGASAPEIVGGLAAKAQDRGGVKAVNALIDDNDRSVLDDLGGFFANKKSDEGTAMLDQIFGADRSSLLEGLVNKTGLSEGIIGKVLPLLAPVVLSVVGGQKADGYLDDEGIVTLLTNETADLEKDGFLSGSIAAKGVAAAGAAAAKAVGSAGKSSKKVRSQSSESVKGKAESMKDKAKGKAEAMKDQASAAKDKAGDAKNQAAKASGKAADKAADVKGQAAKASGKAKGKAAEAVKGQASSAKGKAKAASAKGAASTKKQAGAAKGRAAAATDRVGATTKSTKVAASSGNSKGGLGWIGYALGLLALVAVLALLASQCSSSDEETETDADSAVDADASADLQGLVDAELPDGVSASIDGDVVTLTGDVASQADADAAVAAAEGVEGVGSVVNELTVTEADADADADTDADAAAPLDDLGDITFNYNSAQLTAEGEAVVAKWAAYLEENADTNVQIVGHTDSDGAEDDNVRLSQRRAESVKASLEAKGIAADRMTTDGKGEASPKVENDSEANKAINRRIEFIEQ